jgi:hypothetical protein
MLRLIDHSSGRYNEGGDMGIGELGGRIVVQLRVTREGDGRQCGLFDKTVVFDGDELILLRRAVDNPDSEVAAALCAGLLPQLRLNAKLLVNEGATRMRDAVLNTGEDDAVGATD